MRAQFSLVPALFLTGASRTRVQTRKSLLQAGIRRRTTMSTTSNGKVQAEMSEADKKACSHMADMMQLYVGHGLDAARILSCTDAYAKA